MQTILYFLKRFYIFLKVDFLLIKSVNKIRLFLFAVVSSIVWAWKIFNTNINIDENIMTIQFGISWIANVYFFKFLNKQNFFSHLIINRGCFYVKTELLLFLLSIVICQYVFHAIFLAFINSHNAISFLTYLPLLAVDALLFASWKTWKYISFQLFASFFVLCYFFITYDNNQTIDFLYFISQMDTFFNKKIYLCISLVEFFMIAKLLTSTQNIKK